MSTCRRWAGFSAVGTEPIALVAVIAVKSVAANLSTIIARLAVFGDRVGNSALVIGVRLAAFALILVGAALIPAPFAPVRRSRSQPSSLRPHRSPALSRTTEAPHSATRSR